MTAPTPTDDGPRPVANAPIVVDDPSWLALPLAQDGQTSVAASDRRPAEPDPFVDWASLWQAEGAGDWLFDDVLAAGRGHAIYAAHKLGKSLFALWVAAQLATSRDDVAVVYLDFEMTEDDLRERLEDMGHGPGTDLSRLHYALLPSLAPLNTFEGGDELAKLCAHVQARHPGRHLLVVIDTTSRAVDGEENDSTPYRAFARWTGMRLKQAGHTFVRLDHAGKDPTRGQRGSSAKGDDVDLVWKMTKTDEGIELRRDLSRIAWAPAKVPFRLRQDPLRYEPVGVAVPAGTADLIARLDRIGVPADATCNQAQRALRDADGKAARRTIVLAAQTARRARPTGEAP